jgi:hypothetical protein
MMRGQKRLAAWSCLLTLLAVAFLANGPMSMASEESDTEITGSAGAEDVLLEGFTVSRGSSMAEDGHGGSTTADADTEYPHTYVETQLHPLCGAGEVDTVQSAPQCGMVRACDSGVLASEFVREVEVSRPGASSAGPWQYVGEKCISFDPDNPPANLTGAPALPVVTWQMVLREVERMGLPSLRVQVQPEDKTLVNFRTNFFAEPEAFERQITLLGQTVDVRAEPSRFHWTFGDGEGDATQSAGSPYPDLEITHEYSDAQVTMRPSVDVTYAAEFRVDGGSWQQIPQTVRIGGPPVSLRVVEATPVLSGEGQDR